MTEKEEKPMEPTEEALLDKGVSEDSKTQPPKRGFLEKLAYVRSNITVEPLLAGLIIPSVVSRLAMMNLNLDKACRVNLEYGDHICDALIKKSSGNYSSYEKEVQKLISATEIWKGIIQTTLPSLIIIFLGSWSDRTGKRKIIIMLPMYGELLTSLNNLLNVYFFYEIPVQVTVLMETLCYSITGGWVTMFLGVFSYISDITDEETRTFRVGLVNFCLTAGLPLGMALSGILVTNMGYYGIFTTTAVLFSMVLLYGIFFLKEPEQWLQNKGLPPLVRPEAQNTSFFNISHVSDTVKVVFRERPKNRRLKIMFILFVVFILFGPQMSEHAVFYLFVRNKLNWNMTNFGLYFSYSIILHSCGAMLSITILSKRLQVNDSFLCLISTLSKFCSSMWTAFAKTNLEMYLIPVVDLLNATMFTSLRSMVSKIVDKQETAKVHSIFSLTETMASLVFNPLYSWLYLRTLHVMPGAVFLTSAVITVPAAVIMASFFVQHRKELSKSRKAALEVEQKDAE